MLRTDPFTLISNPLRLGVFSEAGVRKSNFPLVKVGHVARKFGGPGSACSESSKLGQSVRLSHDINEMSDALSS